ncbi:MAG TPA: citrate/2-methylcitrate synthase, partial [Candidatus Dormibacteraeota bacterium]|nr:citrate/2-methylcitrate synthase [Candidatus Dormibacteraeota bacterium]
FPTEMFTVLFAIPRVAGWLSHWQEMIEQGSKIYRPRQLWTGHDERAYTPLSERA